MVHGCKKNLTASPLFTLLYPREGIKAGPFSSTFYHNLIARAQSIVFSHIDGEYDTYQHGKYQNNSGIQPSMLWKDFQKK